MSVLDYGDLCSRFNPRTYIRYDRLMLGVNEQSEAFQSTYLYKVRLPISIHQRGRGSFNPRTYIRYDVRDQDSATCALSFNPRTYIRYDNIKRGNLTFFLRFNPRTYIRYDLKQANIRLTDAQFQSTYLYKVRLILSLILLRRP